MKKNYSNEFNQNENVQFQLLDNNFHDLLCFVLFPFFRVIHDLLMNIEWNLWQMRIYD